MKVLVELIKHLERIDIEEKNLDNRRAEIRAERSGIMSEIANYLSGGRSLLDFSEETHETIGSNRGNDQNWVRSIYIEPMEPYAVPPMAVIPPTQSEASSSYGKPQWIGYQNPNLRPEAVFNTGKGFDELEESDETATTSQIAASKVLPPGKSISLGKPITLDASEPSDMDKMINETLQDSTEEILELIDEYLVTEINDLAPPDNDGIKENKLLAGPSGEEQTEHGSNKEPEEKSCDSSDSEETLTQEQIQRRYDEQRARILRRNRGMRDVKRRRYDDIDE